MNSKGVKELKNPAPVPRDEEDLKKPMKLYTYLICISGLANYPPNTRMFRQKNLCPTAIYKAIGITDKTVKQYLHLLEEQGLVLYKGEIKYLSEEEVEQIHEKLKKNNVSKGSYQNKYDSEYGAMIWKKRNKKERNGVYYIPRPDIWTPIPENTI